MVEQESVWPAVVVLCIVLLVQTFFVVGLVNNNIEDYSNKPANVDLTSVVNVVNDQNDKLDALNGKLDSLSTGTTDATKLDVVYSKLTEDDVTEAKALELATESVNSRDFKKAVFDALVDYGVTIEDYKDITELKVLDFDVDKDTVTFEVKVYYFIDGDSDETEKARLDEFDVTVDNLDFDEDFEEAEVDESYLNLLSVNKVYD